MGELATKIGAKNSVRLRDLDTRRDGGLTKEGAAVLVQKFGDELFELLALMYGAKQNSLLIVLQGRDTAGKDGLIKALSHHVNIQSFRVASFKVPTEEERAHDFLWRLHKQSPELGHGVVFNRSHYEDVLVVRVHDLVPKNVWKPRFEQINQFEELLASQGTIILKFYLHISKEEQEERLKAREEERAKYWKLSAGDWEERDLWESYTDAYEDALAKCSTDIAPWYVVAADHKWFRDLAVVSEIVERLKPYREAWEARLEEIGQEAKKELAAYRRKTTRET